uniref:Uncharacterized protein n=1 Tax=Salmonella sp. TaxID=599 RepID=A0A482ETN4_SALSP|nr:hypothetical protein [Salmonella sp.]QBM91386.1 hypothetical protein NNIBIDOC_00053 [Salmonella sp.]
MLTATPLNSPIDAANMLCCHSAGKSGCAWASTRPDDFVVFGKTASHSSGQKFSRKWKKAGAGGLQNIAACVVFSIVGPLKTAADVPEQLVKIPDIIENTLRDPDDRGAGRLLMKELRKRAQELSAMMADSR